jgi:Pyruvate/2-oxoacid:ferredoxin oxidoreductase delta subunit
MPPKDLYLELVKSSEFLLGEVPNRENILWALRQTIAESDLRVYFMLPVNISASLPYARLEEKARKQGISSEDLQAILKRLYAEAFVAYQETPDGRTWSRCPLSLTAEQQVRLYKGTPRGKAYADYWLGLAEVSAVNLPTRTPYFRVLPVESTVKKTRIEVNHPIPDPRTVLPLDIISEMVRNLPLIAVSECYCRLSREMQGHVCDKPRETCFSFNDFGRTLINVGVARQVSVEETLTILQKCEEAGLVHNIDNYTGAIRTLCNCCGCCCPAMQTVRIGKKNVDAVSRYQVVFDPGLCAKDHACVDICPIGAIHARDDGLPVFDHELCFGCGLCVSHCPQGALQMIPREKAPQVLSSGKELTNRLMREAVVGMVVNTLTGKKPAKNTGATQEKKP